MRSSASRLRSARHTAPALQRWGRRRTAEMGLGAVRVDARLGERRHHLRRERLGPPLRLERERKRGGRVVQQLELLLEACHHANVELRLKLAQRIAQEAARAALPWPAVGLSDVA